MAEPRYETAHSLFAVKAIDAEQRLIEGFASTPELDRQGDSLDPTGAKFGLPLPFLWQHNKERPIGHVLAATVTADGIQIRARIERNVLPFIEEAWALIKSGLVRGLSVGWLPLSAPTITKGAFRYASWEWLELSAVTVPANRAATIQLVKSLDRAPAAPGPATIAPALSAGASAFASAREAAPSMTISEQLTTIKTDLRAKSARLTELVTQANPETREERDTLTTDIKDLASKASEYEALEMAQAHMAAPVVHRAPAVEPGPTATYTPRVEVRSPLPPGIEFARAVQCKMASILSGGSVSPVEFARQRFPDYPRISAFLKAAVTAHTTADGAATGGTELVYAQNLTTEFLDFLRPTTIIGKFGTGGVPSLRRVPFNVRITGQSSGGAAAWVGQGSLKPITKYDFSAVSLTWAKVAAITVQSDELARFSSPSSETLLRDALAGSIRERLDIDFIVPTKALVANVSPASITNGIAALTESGTDAAALRADVGQLVSAFISANNPLTSGVFITSQSVALQAGLMRNALGQREFPEIGVNGGTLEGFPVITSQYAAFGSPPANILALVNADDIFLADDGQVSIDVSREASLEMSDDPNNEAGTVVSLFQANLMALRAERYINWARARASAVAYFDAAAYASGSPA